MNANDINIHSLSYIIGLFFVVKCSLPNEEPIISVLLGHVSFFYSKFIENMFHVIEHDEGSGTIPPKLHVLLF